MMRMVYQNIMANTLDGKTVQHDWWVNVCQMVRHVISLNLTSLAEGGMGGHPPWARPQVHDAHCSGQEVSVHVPQSGVPEQMS